MKITMESTSKMVTVNGVPARIWEGTTEGGVPVHAFVVRLGVAKDADQETFRRELQECREPSPEIAAIPLSMVL